MARSGRRLPRLFRLPWLTSGLCAAGLGCASLQAGPGESAEAPAFTARAAAPEEAVTAPAAPAAAPGKAVPISLDTVLRLAEEQNAQIGVAREQVNEAFLQQGLLASAWLPKVYVGTAYYRHEGGIQDETGQFLDSSFGNLFAGLEIDARLDLREVAFQRIAAERQVLQNQGELSRITTETLIEALETYIDLLTARSGEAVSVEMEKLQLEQLKRAEGLAKEEPIAELQVEFIRSEVRGQRQIIARLRHQGNAAAAKLAYLLGLEGCVTLVPVDGRLVPFTLVDTHRPACELVDVVLAGGPGVRELQALIALIQGGIAEAQGPGRFVPVFEARMLEGAFGAGPGSSLTWDNRWDLGIQVKWNLTDLCTTRQRLLVAESKLAQAHLTYQDLRGKLTAGVQEAADAIAQGGEQIRYTEEQIRHASEAYRIAFRRREDNVGDNPTADVMLAIRGLQAAHLAYLTAVAAYDKAQVRLMVLLGPTACPRPGAPVPADGAPPAPAATGRPNGNGRPEVLPEPSRAGGAAALRRGPSPYAAATGHGRP